MTAADVYKALWRHRLLIAVGTIVIVAATWFATVHQTKIYRSGVLIRVSEPINDPGQAFGILQAGQQLAQTYARIVQTRTVAESIYQNLGQRVPLSSIEGNVHGSPVQSLELLTVTADSKSPQLSALIANAAPDALRAFIRQSRTLREQITVVETAVTPTAPFKPNLKLNLILAVLLGLFLNGAFAMLREFLSDRLPASHELESLVGHPVLATVPSLHFADGTRVTPAFVNLEQSPSREGRASQRGR